MTAHTPSNRGPLAAQSRDDPEPYSLPARMTSGTFSARYFSEASKIVISAPSARWRRDDDLRSFGEIPGREGAAGHSRRQGIRFGIIARLGGQGTAVAGSVGCHRGKLRTDSSVQPGG